MTMRLTQRDLDILEDLGRVGLMTYDQIRRLHFPSYISTVKRGRRLQYYDYIKGAFYNTDEKVFILGSEGLKAVKDMRGLEFRKESFDLTCHKIMRAELYTGLCRTARILNWTNEVRYDKLVFDSYFECDSKMYLCEVVNTQKTKHIEEKVLQSLTIDHDFTLVIYCRNKDIIRNMWERLTQKGSLSGRRFAIKVFEYKEPVSL
jgi:hypothetical protein